MLVLLFVPFPLLLSWSWLSVFFSPHAFPFESNSKKCEYLDELRDLLWLKLVILNDRAETIEKRFDIITARAVAPLKKLLPIVFKIKKKESLFFLLKGKNWYKELKEIKNDWKFNIKIVKNREILDTSGGVTIELRKLSKR